MSERFDQTLRNFYSIVHARDAAQNAIRAALAIIDTSPEPLDPTLQAIRRVLRDGGDNDQ